MNGAPSTVCLKIALLVEGEDLQKAIYGYRLPHVTTVSTRSFFRRSIRRLRQADQLFDFHKPGIGKEGPLKAAMETVRQQIPSVAMEKGMYLELLNRADSLPDTD